MSTPRPSLPDALLRQALARRAAGPSTSAELLDNVLAAVEALPQRRGWTRPLVSELRLVPILLLVAVLLSALIGLALFAGGRVMPPLSNGLVAYESGGDIYVGDPATGEETPIVTGPAFYHSPRFSPDGTHVVFIRGDLIWDGSDTSTGCRAAIERCDQTVVVVRRDGSDERVIVPASFLETGLSGVSWTPDGGSLLVGHDDRGGPRGGYVSLFDASGMSEPLLLTPPLPRWPGAFHPQTGGEIAPMLRPPTGQRVLSYPGPENYFASTALLLEMDLDGSNVTELIPAGRSDLLLRVVAEPVWSPDGEWIAFEGGDGACPLWACRPQNWRAFVMRADGTELRVLTGTPAEALPDRVVVESGLKWSPDGSMVLMIRGADDVDADLRHSSFTRTWQFVVVDVTTGEERIVATRSEDLAPSPMGSWSPDGRSVIVWDGPGTRPTVIDIETGALTELPWASDSEPSWRLTD